MTLSGRHALVCGASRGIGRAAALAIAARGAAVTALARREDALRDLLPELERAGSPRARALVADLDDRDGLRSAVSGLLATGPIHILIHNTGGPPSGRLLDAGEDALLHAFSRHVLTAQLLVQLLVPGMTEAGYGRIITVTSTSVREPIPNLGVSNTTRAAMAGWAKTLSRELPPGVTINNVLPGYTDTERLSELKAAIAARGGRTPADVETDWVSTIPEGRIADPSELGAVIGFLVSPEASYVRGVSLPVDGGRLRSI